MKGDVSLRKTFDRFTLEANYIPIAKRFFFLHISPQRSEVTWVNTWQLPPPDGDLEKHG